MGIIYKITNIVNHKAYCGKTTYSLEHRWYGHISECNKGSNNYFHNAIKKYGKNNFRLEILYENTDDLILNVMETFSIMVHKTHKDEGGYNLTWGGEGLPRGYEVSQNFRDKMRDITLGKNNPMYNKQHTKESIEKMKKNAHKMYGDDNPSKRLESRMKRSKSMKGKIFTEEHKRNMRKYSDIIRKEAIQMINNGVTAKKVSEQIGIPKGTIYTWYYRSRK